MNEKVAVIACAMALPGEKGYTRFSYLSKLLCDHGYEVDLYTSTFNHWEKAQRNSSIIKEIQKKVPYSIKMGYEPGYKRNVDIHRVLSHRQLSSNILKIIKSENRKEKYSLIYCVIPDNLLAAKISKFGSRNAIPVIIDIEDLWPEGMKLVFNKPIISDIVFYPFSYFAKKAYKHAVAFVGTSDEYRDEPIKYNQGAEKERITVYVGCDLDVFDKGVSQYSTDIEKKEGEFWIIYTGTIGSSYDIETLIKAAQIIKKEGYDDIKIKILGGGPLEAKCKLIATERECNVDFLGYQPYEKMAAYISKSDVTVNSFVKSAPQSIVNKVGDYLAGGKPMINTLHSKEFRIKVETDGFGMNVEAEDEDALANAILYYYKNPIERNKCGIIARKIAEEQFDRKNSYSAIENLISKKIKGSCNGRSN